MKGFHLTPPFRGFPGNCVTSDGFKVLESWGYQDEKRYDGILSGFDTIHDCEGRTPHSVAR